MGVLSYQSIKKADILRPFYERTMYESTNLSYGCGAASYDIRLAENIHLYEGSITLASAIEHFTMPNNVCGVVHDKSSLVRAGISLHNTFIDPGWRGYLTLEISYHQVSSLPKITNRSVIHGSINLELTAGTPIAQIVFHYLDEPTEQPYSGQYQDQKTGAQPSKIKVPDHVASRTPDELRQIDRFGKVWLGRNS